MSEKRTFMNERVYCKDGFNFSCQANKGAYCSPRRDNAEWYEEVEIGYPSVSDSLLDEYAEQAGDPCNTVYPYVPSSTVYILIAKHGGIERGQVPRGVPEFGATHYNHKCRLGLEEKDQS